MAESILVVAPHPDDETLGVGGTLLRHKAAGDQCHWLITTTINEHPNFDADRQQERSNEITSVAKQYGFASTTQLPFLTTRLDQYSASELIDQVGAAIREVKPSTVYVPYRGDIHSDHQATFDAVMACCKAFRNPSVQRIYMYETMSETDYAPPVQGNHFVAHRFVDISAHLEQKLDIMKTYASELAPHPFPRSLDGLRALAMVRGAAAHVQYAESFMVVKDIWK